VAAAAAARAAAPAPARARPPSSPPARAGVRAAHRDAVRRQPGRRRQHDRVLARHAQARVRQHGAQGVVRQLQQARAPARVGHDRLEVLVGRQEVVLGAREQRAQERRRGRQRGRGRGRGRERQGRREARDARRGAARLLQQVALLARRQPPGPRGRREQAREHVGAAAVAKGARAPAAERGRRRRGRKAPAAEGDAAPGAAERARAERAAPGGPQKRLERRRGRGARAHAAGAAGAAAAREAAAAADAVLATRRRRGRQRHHRRLAVVVMLLLLPPQLLAVLVPHELERRVPPERRERVEPLPAVLGRLGHLQLLGDEQAAQQGDRGARRAAGPRGAQVAREDEAHDGLGGGDLVRLEQQRDGAAAARGALAGQEGGGGGGGAAAAAAAGAAVVVVVGVVMVVGGGAGERSPAPRRAARSPLGQHRAKVGRRGRQDGRVDVHGRARDELALVGGRRKGQQPPGPGRDELGGRAAERARHARDLLGARGLEHGQRDRARGARARHPEARDARGRAQQQRRRARPHGLQEEERVAEAGLVVGEREIRGEAQAVERREVVLERGGRDELGCGRRRRRRAIAAREKMMKGGGGWVGWWWWRRGWRWGWSHGVFCRARACALTVRSAGARSRVRKNASCRCRWSRESLRLPGVCAAAGGGAAALCCRCCLVPKDRCCVVWVGCARGRVAFVRVGGAAERASCHRRQRRPRRRSRFVLSIARTHAWDTLATSRIGLASDRHTHAHPPPQ